MDEWRRNRLTSGTEGVLHMGEKRGGQRHQFSQMDPWWQRFSNNSLMWTSRFESHSSHSGQHWRATSFMSHQLGEDGSARVSFDESEDASQPRQPLSLREVAKKVRKKNRKKTYDSLLAACLSNKGEKVLDKLTFTNSLQVANFSPCLDSCVTAHPLDLWFIFISQKPKERRRGTLWRTHPQQSHIFFG